MTADRMSYLDTLARIGDCWAHNYTREYVTCAGRIVTVGHASRFPEVRNRAQRCADCGKRGERTGHQDCQFPQDH